MGSGLMPLVDDRTRRISSGTKPKRPPTPRQEWLGNIEMPLLRPTNGVTVKIFDVAATCPSCRYYEAELMTVNSEAVLVKCAGMPDGSEVRALRFSRPRADDPPDRKRRQIGCGCPAGHLRLSDFLKTCEIVGLGKTQSDSLASLQSVRIRNLTEAQTFL